MALNPSLLARALETLGAVLEQRGQSFEIVAVGGSGLLLLGITVRSTRDLDIVALVRDGRYLPARPLPDDLAEAVRDVAAVLRLAEDWLNAGPADLLQFGLPVGFEQRVVTQRYRSLTVHLASRFDQICLKLYATVDQGPRSKHASDLRQLTPTTEELRAAARWAGTHDPSEGFRHELRAALKVFGVEDPDAEV